MITTKITEWEHVYETEDSFGEYQTYKKKTWYFLGCHIWSKKFDFKDHSVMEYFRKHIL